MTRFRWLLAALCGCVLANTPAPVSAQTRELSDSGELLDGIAAIVNDGVVLKSELQTEVERIAARLRAQGTQLPPAQTLVQQVLDRLIIQRIQLQRAEKVGIQVSDETLNQALTTIAQRNNVPLAEFPAVLAREGVDYGEFRRDLRNQIIVDQLRQKDVTARIGVAPKEVDEFLAREQGQAGLRQEYQLSHILVSVSESASSEQIGAARAKIDDLAARLARGEDFAKLAVAYSDGAQALEGGDLGWRKGADLPSIFAEVAPGLQKGQVSAVLRNASGFHLVKLQDRRGGEPIIENQARARHILLKTSELLDDAAVRQKLGNLRERIVKGEDFAAVARVESDDPQSAIEGGDLGWSGPGSFVPAFEKVLAELTPGQISEPFKTQYGWHIVQLMERRVHDATADKQRQEAILAIRSSKLGEETDIWVRRLRDEAFVEIRI